MLTIYVYENNRVLLEKIKSQINLLMKFYYEHSELSIFAFSDSLSFLNHLENSENTGVYILDVDIDGLDLAETIRKKDPLGFIIIISAYSKYIQETYFRNLGAIAYIIKNNVNLEKQINDALIICLNRYQQILNKTEPITKKLILHIRNTSVILEHNQIYLIKTDYRKHSVYIYHGGSVTKAPYTLSYIIKQLNSSYFIHCNRSEIINIQHIKQLDKTKRELTLKNNIVVNVSKRALSQIINLFTLSQ